MSGIEIGLLCLALNVYYEARSESWDAQLAVALVTRNRARLKGQTYCDVVYAPYQFSWTLDIQQPPAPTNEAWIRAQAVAWDALTSRDITGGALWFHTESITPWWRWNKEKTGQWGAHIFYKCKPKYHCAF